MNFSICPMPSWVMAGDWWCPGTWFVTYSVNGPNQTFGQDLLLGSATRISA